MKQLKWDVILTSLLYVVLGIVVLLMPGIMFKTLGYLIGAFLIVAGAVSMIGYLLRDAYQSYFRNDFVYGLIEITIGIIVLYKIDMIRTLVPIILGVLVVASGCRKLQDVIDMKRMEYGNWIAMLVLAAVNVVFGVVLILDPIGAEAVLERLIGIGLIVSGLTDCAIACYFAGKIRKYLDRFETVDSTGVEVPETDGKQPESRKAEEDEEHTAADRKGSFWGDGIGAGADPDIKPEIEVHIASGTGPEIEAGNEAAGEDKGEEQ